jgi:hypothetical protein
MDAKPAMITEQPVQEREPDQIRLDRFTAWALEATDRHTELPVKHLFTPGLYVRQMFAKKGVIVVSRKHKTTHPFLVLSGACAVWCPGKGWERLQAPHIGVTTPGTQRLILALEDLTLATFHPGPWPDTTDPQRIVEELTDAPDLDYLKDAPPAIVEAFAKQQGEPTP